MCPHTCTYVVSFYGRYRRINGPREQKRNEPPTGISALLKKGGIIANRKRNMNSRELPFKDVKKRGNLRWTTINLACDALFGQKFIKAIAIRYIPVISGFIEKKDLSEVGSTGPK